MIKGNQARPWTMGREHGYLAILFLALRHSVKWPVASRYRETYHTLRCAACIECEGPPKFQSLHACLGVLGDYLRLCSAAFLHIHLLPLQVWFFFTGGFVSGPPCSIGLNRGSHSFHWGIPLVPRLSLGKYSASPSLHQRWKILWALQGLGWVKGK